MSIMFLKLLTMAMGVHNTKDNIKVNQIILNLFELPNLNMECDLI